MDVQLRVGLNVRRYRKERGLPQEALAFECGLHRTYISGAERGIANAGRRLQAAAQDIANIAETAAIVADLDAKSLRNKRKSRR